jgi:putative phosphonate metabolism protein
MRYAVYVALPSGHPLAAFGAAWLGRDALDGKPVPRPPLPGWADARLDAITAEPRRYGFHATLKPPFTLAQGQREEDLLEATDALARTRGPVPLDSLGIASLGGFVALTLGARSGAVDALAAACVAELDRFRAPPDAAELARRRGAGLTARQSELLRLWGYPFVMDEFRFHMTLTGRLEREGRDALMAALAPQAAPALSQRISIADLCVFVEPGAGAPFTFRARFPLRGG